MRTEVIANRLSIICGGPFLGACCCAGVTCGNTCCARWWELVMQDEEIRVRATKFYEDYYSGDIDVGKILSKSFLIDE